MGSGGAGPVGGVRPGCGCSAAVGGSQINATMEVSYDLKGNGTPLPHAQQNSRPCSWGSGAARGGASGGASADHITGHVPWVPQAAVDRSGRR